MTGHSFRLSPTTRLPYTKGAISLTEVNGFHSASSVSLHVINALQFTIIELNQSIHIVVKREKLNTIVLELECLVSEQSLSGHSRFTAFRRVSREGAAGNESLVQSIYTDIRL